LVAARSLGWTEIEAVRVPADWTADQVKAYAIADNRSAELAEWDDKVLASQLLELDEAGFDITSLGFELPVAELTDVIEDEIPEDDVEPKAKLGQVWSLGNHRLMCGDSTSMVDGKKLMNGQLATMVFTDPPYNTGMTAKTNGAGNILSHMFDDDYTDFEWQNLLAGFTNVMASFIKKDAAMYICFAWKRNHELLPYLLKSFKLANIIIWDKIVQGMGWDYQYSYELVNLVTSGEPTFNPNALAEGKVQIDEKPISYPQTYEIINVLKNGKPKINSHQGDEQEFQDVWHIQRVMGRNDMHATAKPLALCGRAIRHASRQGDIVLDLFGGSGSTFIAAEQLGRVCYMMEFDPKYVDTIIARWEKLTGKTAELIKD
jgi:site-specific DNA-methyltransferase (adenine-specific)